MVTGPPCVNSTTRKNSPNCDLPLYIAVISEPIIELLVTYGFRI